jgi:hypothetical protein
VTVNSEKLEVALEVALTTLCGVAATGTNDEKVAAAKELVNAVQVASTELRKEAVTARVLPLLDAVSRNLAGQLTEGDTYAPVYGLDAAQQGSLLLTLTKEVR